MSKNKNWFIESTVEAGEVIINDGGSAVDFRIEGDEDSNLFVTDGSEDKVGIGTNKPSAKLEVTSDTIGSLLQASNHNVSSTMPSEMILQKSRGNKLSPSTLNDSDEIGKITFKGYDGSSYDELAHIKVSSISVASDTSSMTFHSDKFILDTGGLQFGTTGANVTGIAAYSVSSAALDSSASDTDLVTAKQVYESLTYAGISSLSWSGTPVANQVPRANNSTTLTASNIYSGGASGKVSIGSDTTGSGSGKFQVTGNSDFIGTLTVGVDDTGHDVKLFGATSGKFLLWDESADLLQLGTSGGSAGVDFIAYGATNTKLLQWDESADKLFVYGHAHFGKLASDELAVKGKFKLSESGDTFKFYGSGTAQSGSEDIFQIYNDTDVKSVWVEHTGELNIESKIKINTHVFDSLKIGSLGIGVGGSTSQINFDIDSAGSKSMAILNGSDTLVSIMANNAITIDTTVFTVIPTSETKFKTPAFKINDVADSSSAGVLEVAKVTTSSGGLTLDSQSGTITADDNLTVTGNLTVSGSANFSGTTNSSFNVDTGGNNLGWKAISLTDHADNTTPGLAITKYLHAVDSTGNAGTAGIAVNNIHSESNMTISTKDAADILILAPGYNHDDGTVFIGTSTSKQSNLVCYGNASISGNLTVSGTLSGSFDIDGTTSTDFQFDSGGSGPKINIGSDDLIQTVASNGSTTNMIHTKGILLDSVYGGGDVLTLQSYNQEIQLTPGSNANTERFVKISGSLNVDGSTALTYNYLSGAGTKIGASANSNFSSTSDLASGDTVLYTDSGKLELDASSNDVSITGADFIFGAEDTSGNNSTDGNRIRFYGNNTGSYVDYSQAAGTLTCRTNSTAGTALSVPVGKMTVGMNANAYADFIFYNEDGEQVNFDSSLKTSTFNQGVITPPAVASNETINLELSSSSYQFANLASGHVVYNLPVVATSGQRYKIMVADFTNNLTINCDGSETMVGGVVHLNGSSTTSTVDSGGDGDCASTSSTSVVITAPYEGTWIELISNGTNWYVSGQVVSDTGPTFN